MVIDTLKQNGLFLAMAVVGLFSAIRGLKKGEASNFAEPFKRSEHPMQYWSAISMSLIVGIGGLMALIISLWKIF